MADARTRSISSTARALGSVSLARRAVSSITLSAASRAPTLDSDSVLNIRIQSGNNCQLATAHSRCPLPPTPSKNAQPSPTHHNPDGRRLRGEPDAGNPPVRFDVAGAGDGVMAILHGHEAGNGGYRKGKPVHHRAGPRPYRSQDMTVSSLCVGSDARERAVLLRAPERSSPTPPTAGWRARRLLHRGGASSRSSRRGSCPPGTLPSGSLRRRPRSRRPRRRT
jgi:hypothetical protein